MDGEQNDGGGGPIHGGVPPLRPYCTHDALHPRQIGPRRRYSNRYTKLGNLTERVPLDEAAKRVCEELASSPYKTPVSVLQEVLARRGTMPKYELIQVEGMIHEPTFSYRVTVADYVAIGTGRSKKEAKHAAAKALLDKLTGAVPADAPTNGTDTEPITVSVSPYGPDKMMMGNPVGWLQEMCMSRRWPPPLYETEPDEVGLPHERQFTIACVLFKLREVGSGKSKKLAKRQAAHKMWQALQEAPNDIAFPPGAADEDVTVLVNQDFNFVQFLQAIATEQQFEVTYVDIDEKSMSGCCQCLVQLSTLPVAVCYGSGVTSKDAQANAAQNALEYLKIMTKK